MGAPEARFVRRFGRLLGAHSRHPPGPFKALAGDRNGRPGGAFRWAFWAPLGRPLPPPAGADQGPPRVTRSGARGPRFARRFGRLSGPHCRHSRGPIRAPCGWGEWASGGCLPLFVLVAFWAPIPATRGGRSRPRRVAGMGARWVPFPFRFGRFFGRPFPPPAGADQGPLRVVGMGAPGAPFPWCFGRLAGAPPPLPLCPPTFRLCCPPALTVSHSASVGQRGGSETS